MKGTQLHELKKTLFIIGCEFYVAKTENSEMIIIETNDKDIIFEFNSDGYFIAVKNNNKSDEIY